MPKWPSPSQATQSVTTADSGEGAAILRTVGMPCSQSCVAGDVSLLSLGAAIRWGPSFLTSSPSGIQSLPTPTQQSHCSEPLGSDRQQQPQEPHEQHVQSQRLERILFETSNATSLNANRDTAIGRKAHFQAIQETSLTPAQMKGMKSDANAKRQKLHRRPNRSGARQSSGRSWSPFLQRTGCL